MALQSLSADWRCWRNPLWVGGWLLIGLGAVHGVVQAVDPRDWSSVVGWRKPILFGLSTGVTLLSLAWAAGHVRVGGERVKAALRWLIAGPAVVEVGLITVQTWRGAPAHFNTGPMADQLAGATVDGLLVVITACIVWLTAASLRRAPAGLDRAMTAALRWGLVLLCLGCGLGFAVAIVGTLRAHAGLDPHVWPPAGVPKFAHGMPLHAIQMLPIWVLACRWSGLGGEATITRSVSLLGWATVLATAYAIWQVIGGRGRWDADGAGLAMLGLGGLLIAGAVGVVLARRRGAGIDAALRIVLWRRGFRR